MKKIITGSLILSVIFMIAMLAFAPLADARVSRSKLRALEREDVVDDLKIPILFGISVGNLWDSWGDARSGGRSHEGIDILAPRRSLIVSPTEAIVISIDNGGNGGKNVSTINPGGERFYYAHLDDFAEDLDEGDELEPGDLIGYVGNTGNASGGPTHLHFGVYEDNNDAINPFPRLTREFSLKERAQAFNGILKTEDKPLEIARLTVGLHKSTFLEMEAQKTELKITLPKEVITVLGETEKKAVELVGITRTLKLGMSGEDVKLLQTVLGVTADGEFGPKTRTALIAFQIKKGLPGDGVLGLATRNTLSFGNLPEGCTATTAFSPVTGARCSFASGI